VPCYFFILQIWVQVDLGRVFSQLFSRSGRVGCPAVFFQSPTVLHALLNHSSSPPEYTKQDILQWLRQFEISSETKVVYDYDVDPEDWKGVTGMHLTIYKNGIILQKLSGYESLSIRIEFPFLSVNDAKLLFKKFDLLELASGCFGQDEMEINFKYPSETMSATVYFGNGC
jgi:hypothetical protein